MSIKLDSISPDPLKSINIISKALNYVLNLSGHAPKNHLAIQPPSTDISRMSRTQLFLSLKPKTYDGLVMCRAHLTCFNIWKSLYMQLYNQANIGTLGCVLIWKIVCVWVHELAHVALHSLEVPHAGGRSGSCSALELTDAGRYLQYFSWWVSTDGWPFSWILSHPTLPKSVTVLSYPYLTLTVHEYSMLN